MAERAAMILDTCALLWLAAGNEDLSHDAIARINESAVVYVSAISAFEIALKVGQRKLKLPLPPRAWFEAAVEHHNVTVLPLTAEICIEGAQLPKIHNDPCDRFIIAAAKRNKWPVVTADKRFAKYGIETIV